MAKKRPHCHNAKSELWEKRPHCHKFEGLSASFIFNGKFMNLWQWEKPNYFASLVRSLVPSVPSHSISIPSLFDTTVCFT